MEHLKIYQHGEISTPDTTLIIEGPVDPLSLSGYEMHPDLDAFRPPREQLAALVEIASLPEGRIILARDEATIVGYVTFHYPDELERWSQGQMEDLIELGAIEVANGYRGAQLGKRMLALAFSREQMENVIVFTTEYYWHWDLKASGLDVWEYRKMMEKLMKSVDMIWFATDDPEICSHPANCLMARVGKRVAHQSAEAFDRIRFQQRFMY
ncbi:GNAT family N-acetyltransferase [Gorillibacterium massiliense]|uniref:GNAT family N-acetyltransferase n=1 Tax=Gorillibacterium massiliense TaxID=1280390 RepID=UPI0004BA9C71|nr:GNAT family N-acetyltransferase [Gorillibacterium massiliense]